MLIYIFHSGCFFCTMRTDNFTFHVYLINCLTIPKCITSHVCVCIFLVITPWSPTFTVQYNVVMLAQSDIGIFSSGLPTCAATHELYSLLCYCDCSGYFCGLLLLLSETEIIVEMISLMLNSTGCVGSFNE